MLEDFKDWLIRVSMVTLFATFVLGFLAVIFMLATTGHFILASLVFVVGIGGILGTQLVNIFNDFVYWRIERLYKKNPNHRRLKFWRRLYLRGF